jgi:ketosteroid isomerase-like protein
VPRPASPEIVSRVNDAFEWWNDGEPELMVDEYAEDCELDLTAVFTDMPVVHGHDGLRQQVDEFWKTWEGLKMESLDIVDVGSGRFIVDVRLWGRGKRSGAEVEQRFAFLYTLRDSDKKIVRAQLFPSAPAAIDSATEATSSANG